jgi:hypothetical protein
LTRGSAGRTFASIKGCRHARSRLKRMREHRIFACTKVCQGFAAGTQAGRRLHVGKNRFEEKDSFHLFMQACQMCWASTHPRDARHFSNLAQRRAQWNRDLPEASLTSLDDTWSNPASLNASINTSLSLFRKTEGSKPDIAWNFVPETMTPPGLRTLITSRSDSSSGSQKYTQFWLKTCERFADLTYRDSL